MSQHVRVLLDEHVSRALRRTLEERIPELEPLAVGRPLAPPKGTDDEDLLAWCEKERRVLVAGDLQTMPKLFALHLEAGHDSAGVIVYNRSDPFIRTLKELERLLRGARAKDWVNRIVTPPLSQAVRF